VSETEGTDSSIADAAAYARNTIDEIEEQVAEDEAALEAEPALSLEEAVEQADESSA